MRFATVAICLLALCCHGATAARAQQRSDAVTPQLPTNPAAWINSAPISLAKIRGKAAVMYFFEEQCPKCRERWPELLETAAKYQGEPIVFIAVNSGTPPALLARYVRSNRVNWPVIADVDRAVEQEFGVNTISLENIAQVRGVRADGSIALGNAANLDGLADNLLKDASWNVDPEGIPDSLRNAWAGVEFGDYPSAARGITAGLNSSNDDVKAAAERLQEYVQNELDETLASAEKAESDGEVWQAFQLYSQLTEDFRGYELPDDLKARVRTLSADKQVKEEIAAQKRLEAALKLARSPVGRARAVRLLQALVKSAPDTEAGQRALKIMIDLGE